MEVTCIYCKHYTTFKFGNETRVRQGVWVLVRASLQSEVSSAARACSSPPACPLPQKTSTFFGSLCTCFRLGGGKVRLHRHLMRLTHKCYSPATLLVGKEKFKPHSSLSPKKQLQITLKRKGCVQFKIMYPAVCIKKQHQLEGIFRS